MKLVLTILSFSLIYPQNAFAQSKIDSSQSSQIKYYHEKIYSTDEFEIFKLKQLSHSETEVDSLEIIWRVLKLKQFQEYKLKADTSTTCTIVYLGTPIDFTITLSGEKIHFEKVDFKLVDVGTCYPDTIPQCTIGIANRDISTIEGEFQSGELSFCFLLDLSYSKIEIENWLNLVLSHTEFQGHDDEGLPVPVEKEVVLDGWIEVNHYWSNWR